MSEELNDKTMQEQPQNLQAMFEEAQETIDEARERKAKEEAGRARVEYFNMDKEGAYKVRVLPLPPTSTRRGYEYPLHEIMLKLVNPKTGKLKYVMCCRSTEAGMSVDLIDTYRKAALAVAKKTGDEELEKKINSGNFNGGLFYDFKHAMRLFDLKEGDTKMFVWKASQGQFAKLETAKMETWNQVIEAKGNPKEPCPLSSWNKAYPWTITKSNNNGKTEYSFMPNLLSQLPPLTMEQLQTLVNAPALPDIIYRFTKYHLEAEIEFLKQYDEKYDLDIMNTPAIQEVIEKIKGELPADDTSSFSFGKDDEEGAEGESDDDVTFDQIADAFDKVVEAGHKEKSEEMQDVRNMVVDYINRKNLNIKILRTKTTEMLLNEIEDVLDEMGSEPENKPAAKTTSVGKTEVKKEPEESQGEDDKEPEDDQPVQEPKKDDKVEDMDGDGGRNFDTNEPAAPAPRRNRRRTV